LEFKKEIKCEIVIGGGFVALLQYLKLTSIFKGHEWFMYFSSTTR
jgi:hypothetical protein